ncbi:MAG: hypothetical protein Q4P36_07400, partial [Bowdeniella nasicola]|nr:hypothetical protein [Bowdeniella nasicola]
MKTTVRKPLASLAAACLVAALSSLTLTPAYAEPADDSEPVADLYASQVIDDHLSYVVPGEEVTFELEVVNLSKDVPSEDVVLTYELDPSFTGTTVETSGDAGLSCSVDTKADGNVVTCTSDSIGPGQQGFVKVTTRALEEPKDRYYFNEGGLTSATKNAHDGDYLTYAQLGEFVTWDADVRISAEAVGEVVPGESGEWTITVTNAGPETAKSLLVDSLVFQSKITDQGPSAWGYFPELSSEAPNVVCDLACDVEDLAPGESIILTTTVDLSGLDGDEVEATFSVFPFGGDLNPDNNQVTLRYEKTSSEPEQPAEPEEPVEPEQPAEP